MKLRFLPLAAALLLAPPALAHAPKTGVHGGAQTDAGSFHVEVVPDGLQISVYLRDHSDNPVKSDGFKGTAIFVIDGQPQRIPLTPAGDNRLGGKAGVTLPRTPIGAVQITTPTGSTVTGRFKSQPEH